MNSASESGRSHNEACKPKLRMKIKFRKSTSKYFGEAVQIARQLPGYECHGEGREQLHSVDLRIDLHALDLWDDVWKLCWKVHNWKASQIEVEGGEGNTLFGLHHQVNEVRSCHQGRLDSELGDQYCSGKDAPDDEATCFGCRLTRGISRRLGEWEEKRDFYWYQYGAFSDDQSGFVVDRKQIFRIIKKETGTDLCTLCPAFNWSRVRSDIADLPDAIELNDSSEFAIRYSKINNKPLGIEPREADDYASGFPQLFPEIPGVFSGTSEDSAIDQQGECHKRNVPTVQYSEVAGQEQALSAIKDIVHLPLAYPDYYEKVGIEPQRSVILYGPPGNGKTLIAKAVATESNAHLEIINGPEVLSKWVGESEHNLRQVFGRARELQPSVVLIDEIDAIAPTRGSLSQQHEVTLISQLLVLLDGLEELGRVAVIATTNRIEAIDPAIRRAGRFDYHIEVSMPNEAGRKAILETHLRNIKVGPELEASRVATLSRIASLCEGFSGAELAALCREAGQIAIRRGIAAEMDAAEVAIGERDLIVAFEAIYQKRTSGS